MMADKAVLLNNIKLLLSKALTNPSINSKGFERKERIETDQISTQLCKTIGNLITNESI